jgi:hypothetical protein
MAIMRASIMEVSERRRASRSHAGLQDAGDSRVVYPQMFLMGVFSVRFDFGIFMYRLLVAALYLPATSRQSVCSSCLIIITTLSHHASGSTQFSTRLPISTQQLSALQHYIHHFASGPLPTLSRLANEIEIRELRVRSNIRTRYPCLEVLRLGTLLCTEALGCGLSATALYIT